MCGRKSSKRRSFPATLRPLTSCARRAGSSASLCGTLRTLRLLKAIPVWAATKRASLPAPANPKRLPIFSGRDTSPWAGIWTNAASRRISTPTLRPENWIDR
uniref:Uncharacterized protein LOC108042269 n=1 Tax=Drosophila rhopaloa TaxID=1041015 RepID=A0A6P4ECQ8_DRORH